MPTATDFRAEGRILATEPDAVIFNPRGTTYELRLLMPTPPAALAGQRVQCLIRATARKIYTVPSGGNFIVPIAGPPRIVQGRIKYLDQTTAVVHAGGPITIDLPTEDSAYDLVVGPLQFGTMVNVVLLPGASIEDILQPATTDAQR